MSAEAAKKRNSPGQNLVELEDLPDMDSLMEGQESTAVSPGDIVTGVISEKRDNGVLVDIGFKAEGFVPREEFDNFREVNEGDNLDVVLELVEDEENMPLISHQKARVQRAWENILETYSEGDVVRGVIRNRVKGGMIANIGVDAFLPGSQVDVGPVRNLEDFVGQELDLKILKINPERRNIVVSRRELLEQQRAQERAELLSELEIGEVRRGTVKNITDFGAFIDLNGMDGLLHITDMSWGRISHPSEMVKIGDEIDVMVLDVDSDRQRVSLGVKQKEQNPWEDAENRFPIGSRVKGTVVNVMPYGAFVELDKGVEGLVHVSEMSWTRRINRASEVLQVGDEIEAVVLDVDQEQRKISLGLRQTTENPWEKIAEECPCGTKIRGNVRNMTSYGAFVEIRDEVDGMIHVSDMSWTKKINHPGEILEKGQEVEAVVLDVNPEQQRISLGLKQLTDDPWADVHQRYEVGQTVSGTVSKTTSFGAFVELDDGIEGLIHISELSEERVEKVTDVVNVGDKVEAHVIRIDTEERRLGLSLRTSPEETLESGATESEETSQEASMGNLGHALQQAVQGREEDVSEEDAEGAGAGEDTSVQESDYPHEQTVDEEERQEYPAAEEAPEQTDATEKDEQAEQQEEDRPETSG